jgi:hypothetical protein
MEASRLLLRVGLHVVFREFGVPVFAAGDGGECGAHDREYRRAADHSGSAGVAAGWVFEAIGDRVDAGWSPILRTPPLGCEE